VLDELVIGTTIAGTVFLLIGTAGFCAAVAWARVTTTIAVAAGLAVLGLVGWLSFWAYLWSPTVGDLFASTVVVGAAATIAAACRASDDTRRALASTLPALTMALGLGAATIAFIGLWDLVPDPFQFARLRFSPTYELPIDNEIPQLLVDRLAVGGDPRTFLEGWQSSDRPTLQTGLMLITQNFTGAVGVERAVAGLTAGIVCQFTWLPAVALLIRSIGGRRRGVLAGMLFTAMTGTVLVNTLFTWPKLLSAAFVLAAIAVVMQEVPEGDRLPRARLGLAGVLIALGMLAHGAALFALPIVLAVLLYRRRALTVPGLALFATGAGAAYLPWILYQRYYDPPGNRLLFWHLAEIGYPDLTKGGVFEQVRRTYEVAGWHTVVENKWANVVKPFSFAPWQGVSPTGVDVSARRSAEFYIFAGAIGPGWIAVLVALAVLAVAVVRRRERDAHAVRVLLLVGAGIGSLVPWALVMFGPGTTFVHHGSHVFILIALAVPLAWLTDRWRLAGAVVTAAGVALAVVTYLPYIAIPGPWGDFPAVDGPISRRALALAAVGAICVAVSFFLPASFLPASERLVRRAGAAVPGVVGIDTGPLPAWRPVVPSPRRPGSRPQPSDVPGIRAPALPSRRRGVGVDAVTRPSPEAAPSPQAVSSGGPG
jgi:4-amino-4-deoxy-L-arabinose transferase-like glycosyltransferase